MDEKGNFDLHREEDTEFRILHHMTVLSEIQTSLIKAIRNHPNIDGLTTTYHRDIDPASLGTGGHPPHSRN